MYILMEEHFNAKKKLNPTIRNIIKLYSSGEICERSEVFETFYSRISSTPSISSESLYEVHFVFSKFEIVVTDFALRPTILSYIRKQKSHFWLLIWSIAAITAFLSQKQKKEQNVLKFLIWASMCLKKVKSEPGGVLSHVLKKMAISAWVCL